MITAWLRRMLLSVVPAALVLAACGGGGGVGSGGTGDVAGGYGSGTVTGFGSVIVDGLRYDDSQARVEYDTEAGAPDAPGGTLGRSHLAVGQRVELVFDTDGGASRASVFRISPELVGPVTSLAPLQVAGQAVRVNTDPAHGPVTRFGGSLAALSGLALGDRVEVHGVPVPEGSSVVIQATRLDRLPQIAGPWLRLSGTVSALAADRSSFRLGGLTITVTPRKGGGTVITPASAVLAEGQRVQVWTRAAISGGTVAADRVRIVERTLKQEQAVRLSGAVAACPGRPRSAYVCIAATPVALAGARYAGGLDAGSLADGRYVLVDGRFDTVSGAVHAARLRLPQ